MGFVDPGEGDTFLKSAQGPAWTSRPALTPSRVSGYPSQREAKDASHLNSSMETRALGLVLSDLGQVTSPPLGYEVLTVRQVQVTSKAGPRTPATGLSALCPLRLPWPVLQLGGVAWSKVGVVKHGWGETGPIRAVWPSESGQARFS